MAARHGGDDDAQQRIGQPTPTSPKRWICWAPHKPERKPLWFVWGVFRCAKEVSRVCGEVSAVFRERFHLATHKHLLASGMQRQRGSGFNRQNDAHPFTLWHDANERARAGRAEAAGRQSFSFKAPELLATIAEFRRSGQPRWPVHFARPCSARYCERRHDAASAHDAQHEACSSAKEGDPGIPPRRVSTLNVSRPSISIFEPASAGDTFGRTKPQ